MCSFKVLSILVAISSVVLLLTTYYMWLDQRYLVDEVLEGTRLRELTLKEKVTIRVVAPRRLEDLTKFVLDYSICQPVHEIQIIWLHEQQAPALSHFKYLHTHSKVSIHDKYGSTAYDSLYSDVKADTESKPPILIAIHLCLHLTHPPLCSIFRCDAAGCGCVHAVPQHCLRTERVAVQPELPRRGLPPPPVLVRSF